MKICFFLQRRWAFIGNAMAADIKKNFPSTEFCGFVNMRESLTFLKKQKEVIYSALLLEQDFHKNLQNEKIDYEYINWLEKEYGIPNLWPYFYIDRVVMHGQLVREYPYNKALLTHEDMLRLIQVSARAIIDFLEKEKPDAVIISVIGSVGSALLYHVAKKKGIQTTTLELARIKNRIAFSEDYKTFTWVKERFEELESGKRSSKEREEAKKYLHEFRDRPAPYHQQADPTHNNQALRKANIQFLKPKKLAWSIYWHTKTLLKDIKKSADSDYTDIFIWWAVWDKMQRKTRGLIGYTDLYGAVDYNEKFAYFPLHYDPEMATMLYAPYYTDQVQLIKAIARSLPLDMKLYVKEHAAMVGYRSRSYYKEMLKVPNVKLINPSVPGHNLARMSKLTVTITGTGGWESLLFKNPVITFGDVFFNDIPEVKRCRGYEELPYLVKEQLENYSHNEERLLNYISALLEDSVPVDYIDLWVKADSPEEIMGNEGIKGLARALAQKINLKK